MLDRYGPASTRRHPDPRRDRKSTRLNSSHVSMSYAVFCLKKKTGTFGMPGHHSVDGPALAVADHFVVALVKEDALGCSADIACIGGHRRASFRARQYPRGGCNLSADDSLDGLLIRRDVRRGCFG